MLSPLSHQGCPPNILKSQGPECKSEEEITKVINAVSLNFQLIDHYADITNTWLLLLIPFSFQLLIILWNNMRAMGRFRKKNKVLKFFKPRLFTLSIF